MFGRKLNYEGKADAHRGMAAKYDEFGNVLQAADAAKEAAKQAKIARREAKKAADKAAEEIKAEEAKLFKHRGLRIPYLSTIAFAGVGIGTGFWFAGWGIMAQKAWMPFVLAILCAVAASLLVSVICKGINKAIGKLRDT
jgi:hypothetical protein